MRAKVHNEMARAAYELVADLKTGGDGDSREFRSLARSFPSMIQVNGLGCAVSYLYSKKEKAAFKHLYGGIDQWTRKSLEGEAENGNAPELACRVSRLSSMKYRLYTNEVMNLCLWIKRFAEGMLSEQSDTGKEQPEVRDEKK